MNNPWEGRELHPDPWEDAIVLDHDNEVVNWKCVVCGFEADSYEHFIRHMQELEGADLKKHVLHVFIYS